MAPAQTFTVLYSFDNTDGSHFRLAVQATKWEPVPMYDGGANKPVLSLLWLWDDLQSHPEWRANALQRSMGG